MSKIANLDKLISLENLIVNINDYHLDSCIYLDYDEVWGLKSKCAVLIEDELDKKPQLTINHNLEYVVGVYVLNDCIENLKQQKENPSLQEYLNAFLFYYDNDAFIDINHNQF